MKRTIVVLAIICGFLISCGSNAQKEKEMLKAKKEIIAMDSLSNVMDSLKNDIRSSTEALDAILNEIN